ncbi:hypothetical protein LCGC14_1052790 [marine sediment metagenome]|uniref:Uncharacterized protein n=1 Tax=marine sediment metagenome TaxID=412755 RepID=A0A0F9MN87_9ZZZZ
MNDVVLWCFRHKQEVRKGKRACEYRLIWNLDVKSEVIGECDMRDAVVVPMEPDGDLYVFDATKGDEHYDRLDLVALIECGVLVKVERGNDE